MRWDEVFAEANRKSPLYFCVRQGNPSPYFSSLESQGNDSLAFKLAGLEEVFFRGRRMTRVEVIQSLIEILERVSNYPEMAENIAEFYEKFVGIEYDELSSWQSQTNSMAEFVKVGFPGQGVKNEQN